MRGFGSLSLSQHNICLRLLLKGDPRPLPETEEKREKESEGGGYEVAVIPRNAALCSERKMPLADRS